MTNPYLQGQAEIERLKTPLSIQQYAVVAQYGDTTPSVRDAKVLRLINTAPVTVSHFDDGQDGQTLFVVGDGQTTIQHYSGTIDASNGLRIRTNTAANKLLASNLVYIFVCNNFDPKNDRYPYWIESDAGTGGGGGGVSGYPNALGHARI